MPTPDRTISSFLALWSCDAHDTSSRRSLCVAPIVAALFAAGCAPDDASSEATTTSEAMVTESALTTRLENVAPAAFDLHVTGTFMACINSEPRVNEVRLAHPKRMALTETPRGELAIAIADPFPLNLCHVGRDTTKAFRIRLDASTAALGDPAAVHQLSPRPGSEYVVTVNGRGVGILAVGASGLMNLAEGN